MHELFEHSSYINNNSKFYFHIFRCSNKFRELVVDDLAKIFELVFETNEKKPLPKPYAVAKLLKRTGLEAVKEWDKLYGGQLLKIQVAYNSLKRHVRFIKYPPLRDSVGREHILY